MSAADNAGVATTAANDAQQYATAVAAVTGVDGMFSKPVQFQIGASRSETMTVDLTPQLNDMQAALHGASSTYDTFGVQRQGNGSDLVVASAASAVIGRVQTALDAVAVVRATMGATANRMSHVYGNLSNININTTIAQGRIMDADYAQESADMVSNQMLMQAGGKVLRQSGSMASMLMSLLR